MSALDHLVIVARRIERGVWEARATDYEFSEPFRGSNPREAIGRLLDAYEDLRIKPPPCQCPPGLLPG
jgi:hypothetical protein